MMATKEITKESIVDKFYAYAQRNVELMMDGRQQRWLRNQFWIHIQRSI